MVGDWRYSSQRRDHMDSHCGLCLSDSVANVEYAPLKVYVPI